MKISLFKDLKIIDAGTERNVLPLLEKLIIHENDVVLDFCDCGVDYPATSKILDKVLFDLAKLDGVKIFTIIFDFRITDLALHKWFFVGSRYFKIPEDGNEMNNEDFINCINTELMTNSIILNIEIFQEEKVIKKLLYGKR